MKNPEDVSAAFDLCTVLRAEQWDSEAVKVLDDASRNGNCPDYLRLMKADFLASLRQWSAPWETLSGLR